MSKSDKFWMIFATLTLGFTIWWLANGGNFDRTSQGAIMVAWWIAIMGQIGLRKYKRGI